FNAIFAPKVTGKVNGSISMLSNGWSSPLIVVLSGTGVGRTTLLLSLSPTSTNFGNVKVGNKSTSPVELINTGTGSVTITQAIRTGNAFSISGLSLPLTIPAGKNRYFNVTFAPTGTGVFKGNVSIVSNAQNSPANEPLSGTGVRGTTLLLSLRPASTNFGNVVINTPSTLPVEIINTGTGSVTITQAIRTGTAFSISGLSLPLTIPAGKNSSFSVTFEPTTTGAFNGNVSVVSNAQNSPANEPLSGTGINDPYVALSWNASTSKNIVGYNMYRGTHPNGPFNKINTSLITVTSYQDNTVYPGDAYYYMATAVNSQGVESPDSNEAEAIVPTSPGSRTGSGK
ncbi:MAG: choice-of-anchor D domain-containing protein, partial [Candidatus Dormibacteraceae bacterium]